MKCNNCQSEWTARVAVIITKCPFCGHDLTQTAPPVIEQKISFADDLKSKTKTKQQLAAERERARNGQIRDNATSVVRDVKRDCMYAANNGLKKLDKIYHIYSYECRGSAFDERVLCEASSALVKEELQKEGFRKVHISLRRGIAKGYDLHVIVKW